MKNYLLVKPGEEIDFIWRNGQWKTSAGVPVMSDNDDLFYKRVEHTRKWCEANDTSFSFEQTIFAADNSHVHSRKVILFKTKDRSSIRMTLQPYQRIEDIMFHSEYDMRMLDAMSDALLITEADVLDEPGPRIVYANKAYERVSGYKINEIIGETPRILQGEASSEEAKKNIRLALSRWDNISQRIINYRRDGTPFLVELNISPVKDATGWYTHWISVQRNISQEQDEINAYIGGELALNAVGFGTWRWEQSTNQMHWDARMFELYQYSSDEGPITYEKWISFIHPDDKADVVEKLKEAKDSTGDWDNTFRIHTAAGQVRYIRSKARLTEDPIDQHLRMIGINWDITKEMLAYLDAEQQREIANRNAKLASLGELAAGVGHEINNPLSIISVLTDYIKVKTVNGSLTEQELSQTCDKIISATQRVDKIVKGLKSISRGQGDKLKISCIDIVETLRDTLELFIEINSQKGLSIELQNYPDHAYAMAEPTSLQQIVVNLLSNATDALSQCKSPQITISMTSDHNNWRLTVQDNGPGIPEGIREKIFEPFVTTKAVGSGTGLGLSISKSLAERMNGQLSMDTSEQGTAFHLSLVATEPPQAATEKDNQHRSLSVLIVEDDNMVSESISQIFELFECNISLAQNGREGIDAIKKHPPFDVILTDMRMPVMDGYEFLNAIIEMEKVEDAKVYTLTGDASSFTKEQRRQISRISDGWLEKPLRYQVIEQILNELRQSELS